MMITRGMYHLFESSLLEPVGQFAPGLGLDLMRFLARALGDAVCLVAKFGGSLPHLPGGFLAQRLRLLARHVGDAPEGGSTACVLSERAGLVEKSGGSSTAARFAQTVSLSLSEHLEYGKDAETARVHSVSSVSSVRAPRASSSSERGAKSNTSACVWETPALEREREESSTGPSHEGLSLSAEIALGFGRSRDVCVARAPRTQPACLQLERGKRNGAARARPELGDVAAIEFDLPPTTTARESRFAFENLSIQRSGFPLSFRSWAATERVSRDERRTASRSSESIVQSLETRRRPLGSKFNGIPSQDAEFDRRLVAQVPPPATVASARA